MGRGEELTKVIRQQKFDGLTSYIQLDENGDFPGRYALRNKQANSDIVNHLVGMCMAGSVGSQIEEP